MKKNKSIIAILIVILIILVQPNVWQKVRDMFTIRDFKTQLGIRDTNDKVTSKETNKRLSEQDYNNELIIVVNQNQSDLNVKDLQQSKLKYELKDKDLLNRSRGGKIIFNKNMLPQSSITETNMRIAGWNKTVEKNQKVWTKEMVIPIKDGKEIPKNNTFVSTRDLSKKLAEYQKKISEYINQTNDSVGYEATTIYNGVNPIPSGVHVQAKSVEDNQFQFNIYVFNQEHNYNVNHLTGNVKKN